jgi:hypothetical protein
MHAPRAADGLGGGKTPLCIAARTQVGRIDILHRRPILVAPGTRGRGELCSASKREGGAPSTVRAQSAGTLETAGVPRLAQRLLASTRGARGGGGSWTGPRLPTRGAQRHLLVDVRAGERVEVRPRRGRNTVRPRRRPRVLRPDLPLLQLASGRKRLLRETLLVLLGVRRHRRIPNMLRVLRVLLHVLLLLLLQVVLLVARLVLRLLHRGVRGRPAGVVALGASKRKEGFLAGRQARRQRKVTAAAALCVVPGRLLRGERHLLVVLLVLHRRRRPLVLVRLLLLPLVRHVIAGPAHVQPAAALARVRVVRHVALRATGVLREAEGVLLARQHRNPLRAARPPRKKGARRGAQEGVRARIVRRGLVAGVLRIVGGPAVPPASRTVPGHRPKRLADARSFRKRARPVGPRRLCDTPAGVPATAATASPRVDRGRRQPRQRRRSDAKCAAAIEPVSVAKEERQNRQTRQ